MSVPGLGGCKGKKCQLWGDQGELGCSTIAGAQGLADLLLAPHLKNHALDSPSFDSHWPALEEMMH